MDDTDRASDFVSQMERAAVVKAHAERLCRQNPDMPEVDAYTIAEQIEQGQDEQALVTAWRTRTEVSP